MHENARSVDGREMPLMTIISQSLKFIADKAIEKLSEQVLNIFYQSFIIFLRLEKLFQQR